MYRIMKYSSHCVSPFHVNASNAPTTLTATDITKCKLRKEKFSKIKLDSSWVSANDRRKYVDDGANESWPSNRLMHHCIEMRLQFQHWIGFECIRTTFSKAPTAIRQVDEVAVAAAEIPSGGIPFKHDKYFPGTPTTQSIRRWSHLLITIVFNDFVL